MSAWLEVQCPKCEAPAREKCYRTATSFGYERRSSPHSERRALARKVTGRDFATSQPAKVIDLMAALKESLASKEQS